MPRYKCIVEYDGSPFSGWQRQSHAVSVQETVERAVEAFCGEAVTVHVAGRTDAGVHAEGQVFHMDLSKEFRPYAVRAALNAHLRPHPVAILSAERVSEEFHARFSAKRRRYRYDLLARRAESPLLRGRVGHSYVPLDAGAMREAASYLVGRHDFTSFRSTECQADSPVRTLDKLEIAARPFPGGGDMYSFHPEARSFLHGMVRIIVGTLTEVGRGARPPEWAADVLSARSRAAAGPTAAACGLYLAGAEY